MEDFQSRFRETLRRRLYPNASLHLKEIAGAIGRSENTVTRWWRGETRITAEDLHRIAQVLARRGDRQFLQDVFADLLPVGTSAGGIEESVLAFARAVLAEAGQSSRVGRDSNVWFTADGLLAVAPLGHADYVRRVLRLPEGAGDLAAYAMRVLGWIAITDRADGVVVIRHDGRRVAPLAAERICEWLDDCADRIPQVRRAIHMEGRWIEAHHPEARAAAAAIAKVAFIVRIPRRAWIINPLPLDSITDARLADLLRTHYQAPDKLVHAAADMGAFTTSNVFGVSGDDVISHHIGTSLGFDPSTFEGLNVLSRPDTDYALMVQARVLRTRREGANYNELIGTIDDRNVRYLNLAMPEPGPMGRVLTSSVVLEIERIAA